MSQQLPSEIKAEDKVLSIPKSLPFVDLSTNKEVASISLSHHLGKRSQPTCQTVATEAGISNSMKESKKTREGARPISFEEASEQLDVLEQQS